MLGRFGHHPDPALDFCVEVEILEGMAYDRKAGIAAHADLEARIFRAMTFNCGLEPAVSAKAILRKIEAEVTPKKTCGACGRTSKE